MSGPFEKYVAQAAEAIDPTAIDPSIENHAGYVRQFRRDKALGQARAVLAAVGPLIQEDTRERMVAAAGAALEREGCEREPVLRKEWVVRRQWSDGKWVIECSGSEEEVDAYLASAYGSLPEDLHYLAHKAYCLTTDWQVVP